MEDKKDIIVEADEIQANSSNAEPLAKRIYTMKAFQSSYQPETITWDSVGDKVNYNANGAITSDQWVRQGIYLCSSDQFGGPGFFLTDYDGFYDLPAYGSMFFKAVMCKLGLKVMVPPYSTFLAVINIDRTVYKEGDGDSSAWLGMASGECNKCNTISENNCEVNGGWTGIPIEDGYYTYMGRSYQIDEMRPCVYKTWSISNRYSEKEVRASLNPIYLMNMMELPQKHATYMGYVDKYHFSREEFSISYTAYVWYDGDYDVGGFDEKKATRIELMSRERTGYIMKGWLDPLINVLYPAGGAYRQRRGAKLQGQWIEDVVPYTVAHYHADRMGKYSRRSETFYYMAGGMVCPQPEQNVAYKTPEPITACVAADGSTVIEYYYEIMEYPVQYCANGGHFENGSDFQEIMLPYGMTIDSLDDKPKRTGYRFVQWNPYPDCVSYHPFTTRAEWKAYEYTVQYDKNDENATGEMEPQGFVYDQPQKLYKNTYECKHTVSFAVGDRRGDNAFFQPQTVECHFMGWAETATGKKVYDDGAAVCNLTSERDGAKTLYAVWKSAGILLPQLQIYHEGFYFDAWYLDEGCKEKAGEPGSLYIPTKSETLYGKLVCTEVKNPRWEQGKETVEERTIKAAWDSIDEATSYIVQLMDETNKQILPFKQEDLQEGDKLIGENMIETTNSCVSLTATLAQYTSGGKYTFTVQPQIEGIKTNTSKSKEITTLARPEKPGWRDDVIAVWKSVLNAQYYILQFLSDSGRSVYEEYSIRFEKNLKENMSVISNEESKLKVFADDGIEQNVDIASLFAGLFDPVCYTVKAYNDDTYTPLYEPPAESDYNF